MNIKKNVYLVQKFNSYSHVKKGIAKRWILPICGCSYVALQDAVYIWLPLQMEKLDRVGPVDNRPTPTSPITLPEKKIINYVTHDKWHVTRDTWHVTRGWRWTFSQNFSSYGLGVLIFWKFGGKGSPTQSINEWVTKVLVEQPRLHRVC